MPGCVIPKTRNSDLFVFTCVHRAQQTDTHGHGDTGVLVSLMGRSVFHTAFLGFGKGLVTLAQKRTAHSVS